jgi:hypothetical protein
MLFHRLCILILLMLATEAQATRAIPDDNLVYPRSYHTQVRWHWLRILSPCKEVHVFGDGEIRPY